MSSALPLGPEPIPRPLVRPGIFLALASAAAFGFATPWIARAGRGLGPFTTAALLYAGAGLTALGLGWFLPRGGPRVGRRQALRLVGIAAAGAFVAPVAFVWGLQRIGPTSASLFLNLEAIFTAILAAWVLHERIGRRVRIALVAMTIGGSLLVLDHANGAGWSLLGTWAVVLASAAWALDNVLTRPLADFDPLMVVRAKGLLGACAAGVVAVWTLEPLPGWGAATALVICGATGYGVSLRLYLAAQRRLGAGRTASIFAAAPFLGSAAAWALGDRAMGLEALAGVLAMAVGVVLHATERHSHVHVHEPKEHDHSHTHDDRHHAHAHAPPVAGEHSHRHSHEGLVHLHEHVSDLHHEHHRSRRATALRVPSAEA